ncbi:Cyclin-D-binding Myb-like transcription factor 1 [Chionoecetes opilio]|uniref:Cyclin-D-binding Myb-like transcription factor 1 n=1 Tax=Chionoecetes opilio TaxID=41210 RepID=A0A8J4Y9U2_CHIOP|nr:Cyclin-D-binding Myb-like transcription factor 1 [Chionoecetes opilio]
MEVVEVGEEALSQHKKIRLVVASDAEGARSSKGDVDASEQATTVLLYSSSGHLVRAEIMVDSLNENIIAVPLGTDLSDLAKKSKSPELSDDSRSEVLKILDTPGPTPKKMKSSSLLMVRTAQAPAAQCNALATKHTRLKQGTHYASATTKTLLSEVPGRAQSKASALCTKILMASDTQQQSLQEDLPPSSKVAMPVVEVKSQLSGFSEESLPAFTSAIDKTASQGSLGEDESGSPQAVMMRLNSLGGLELEPVFQTTEALTEAHSENVTKSEDLDVDEVQLDLQSSSAYQVEANNGTVNQSWFTSREDKAMLRWRGHAWRQGMWSKEETDLLQQNIEEYCAQRGVSDPGSVIFKMSKEERSGFYRVIARGLNRPLFSIYRRVIRIYDNHNHIGKYSSEEVSKLRELHVKHGNNWQAIAAHLGRSAASVKDRCRLLNEHCNRGTWSPDEEDRLAAAVYDLAQVLPGEQVTSGISWSEVAGRVRTRSEKQCRTKWLNYLNWKRTSGVEWSKADDVQLICRLSVCGAGDESQVDWTALARVWPACRSPHWLRGKWWNLKRRLPPSVQDLTLSDMCQHLYNLQSISLRQSTLVELPATFLNSSSPSLSAHSPLSESKAPSPLELNQQDCVDLSVSTVKLCIPAANFSHIINTDDDEDEEDFHSRLNGLMQSALVSHGVQVRGGDCASDLAVAEASDTHSHQHFLATSSQLADPSLASSSPNKNSHAIVIEAVEDPLHLHLSAVSRDSVGQASLLHHAVKEEDILSDSEGGHTAMLDPSSPVVSSKLILNDPILSVSGEPLGGEEGLQADPDDSHICTGLAGD